MYNSIVEYICLFQLLYFFERYAYLCFVFGRKIARAILILIPLLGLQNLTMAVKFDSVYYRYFAAVMSSYQVCPL